MKTPLSLGYDDVASAVCEDSLSVRGPSRPRVGWGRSHDVKNLFVVDGSIFVTSAGVNPTRTIQALALYVADQMKQRLANLFAGDAVAEYPLTYFLLALFDNKLGNDARARSYVARYLARVPEDADALLMQLHLALAGGDAGTVAAARAALQSLSVRGVLSEGQRATLALYPE